MNKIDIIKLYISKGISFKVETKTYICTGYNNNFVFAGDEAFHIDDITINLKNLNSITQEEVKEILSITFDTESEGKYIIKDNGNYFTIKNDTFLLQIHLKDFTIKCMNGSDVYFPSFKTYNWFIEKYFDVFNIK